MNRTAKRTLIGAVAAGVVTMTFALSGWSMPPEGRHHFVNPERVFSRLADKLELSEEQRTEAQAILSESRDASAAERARLHRLRQELAALGASFSEAEAREIADEIGDVTAQLAFRHASKRAVIHDLLNSEQREKFENILENHPRARHALRHRFHGD